MFNEQQKGKVERLLKYYLALLCVPVLLHIASSELDKMAGFILWPLASAAYFFAYRKVVMELPKSERFIATWGASTYLPQIFYKASLFFFVAFIYIWGATLWKS